MKAKTLVWQIFIHGMIPEMPSPTAIGGEWKWPSYPKGTPKEKEKEENGGWLWYPRPFVKGTAAYILFLNQKVMTHLPKGSYRWM